MNIFYYISRIQQKRNRVYAIILNKSIVSKGGR